MLNPAAFCFGGHGETAEQISAVANARHEILSLGKKEPILNHINRFSYTFAMLFYKVFIQLKRLTWRRKKKAGKIFLRLLIYGFTMAEELVCILQS